MKTLKLITLAAFALLFAQCKLTSPTAPMGQVASVIDASNIQTVTRSSFFKFADSTNGDPRKAIMLTANWVKNQPDVQAIDVRDSTYINILLKSGMTTTFFFDQIGSDSISLSRGGNSSKPVHLSFTGNRILASNPITNHTVLFYGASNKEFYNTDQVLDIFNKIDTSPVQVTVKMVRDDECTPQLVETFGKYGLVIIDSHGFPDGYLTGTQLVFAGIPKSEADLKNKIIAQTSTDTYNKLLTGEIKIAADVRVNTIIPEWQKHPAYLDSSITLRLMTTTKYISELPAMPNTIIFGNTCYSGASQITESWFTTPIQTAWQNKNVISYYGYTTNDGQSAPVNNLFARVMLDTFIQRLLYARDSTGEANLQQDGSEYTDPYQKDSKTDLFFRQFGAKDYSYMKCGDTLIDSRDGQKYLTICIGKQIWMAQNLNYAAPSSICYDEISSNCESYGKLYDWNTLMTGAGSTTANPSKVKGVCPNGWHVPSSSEFDELIATLGGASIAGGAMKSTKGWSSPNTGATNSSGFSAIPAGYSFAPGSPGTSLGAGTTAAFGSATTNSNGTHAVYEMLNAEQNVGYVDGTLSSANSCRCVKDP